MDVCIVDNFSRRLWDFELGIGSLTPIRSLRERAAAWREATGREIAVEVGDMLDYEFISRFLKTYEPDAVVHFAEQRAAPFSMIDRAHAVFTQYNNVIGNLNLLFGLKEVQVGPRRYTCRPREWTSALWTTSAAAFGTSSWVSGV